MTVRGRPRSSEIDAAIVGAARTLLAEVGYADLSIEEVARRAGVGKPTLYRRYATKGALVAGVLHETLATANPVVPDTGDVADDVRIVLGNLVRQITDSDFGVAVGEMISPASRDADVADAFAGVIERRRTVIRAVIERAAATGRLRVANVEVAIDMALGAVYYRHLVQRQRIDDDFVDELVSGLIDDDRPD